ncbi:transporter substrate-binding domain-containing protein [Thalassospiraceae bacterium LMO-JJ14]|nr:transporter substrate-binding domain-containing protein [Thalassospiraceae bacterium LMO-JJ14]
MIYYSQRVSLKHIEGILIKKTLLHFLLVVISALSLTTIEATASETLPETKKIIAVFPRDFHPYFQMNEDGQPSGFAIDVLNAVAARAGLEVSYNAKSSWSEAVADLQDKRAHVIPNMGISQERKAIMSFTSPVDTLIVSGFVLKNSNAIVRIDDISGHTVGVVETNIAATLMKDRNDINLIVYKDFSDALLGLLVRNIDVFFYPETPVWATATQGKFDHQIRDIGPPLKRIERAIAVRSDLPGVRGILDRELRAFQATDEFEELYRKWHGLKPGSGIFHFAPWWAAVSVATALLLGSYMFARLRRPGTFRISERTVEDIRSENSLRERIIWLITVITVVTLVITGTAIWALYTTAFDEEKGRLLETARSQAELIESVAIFNDQFNSDYPGGSDAATIAAIREGFSPASGTTETTLARRNGDQIVFLFRQLASRSFDLAQVPLNSKRAEPMQRALSGMTGTVVGRDYRNELVLAAYTPVPYLDLGIVVKRGLSEIREPFFQAISFAALVAVFVIAAGVFLFVRLSNPILSRALENEAKLRKVLDTSPIPLTISDYSTGEFLYTNPAAEELFGATSDGLIGHTTKDYYAKISDRERVFKTMDRDGAVRNMEAIAARNDGVNFWVNIDARQIMFEGRKAVVAGIANIDERKKAEHALRESESRFRDFAKSAADSFWETDEENRFTYVSSSIEGMKIDPERDMYGRRREEIKGLQYSQESLQRLYKILSSHKPYRDFECQLIFETDGIEHYIRDSGTPIFDTDKKFKGYRGTLTDITEHKTFVAKLQEASLGLINAIAVTIEKRDPYTTGHQNRVAHLAVGIAKELNWNESQILGLRLGALVHDIGKISIPAEILSRPGKLNDAEYQLIKTHPQTGYDILKNHQFPWPIAEMVIQHHERIDGSGYPRGLTADQILPEAKVIGVADVVEAISSHRPYRAALGIEAGIEEITRGKGTAYDPDIVDACIKLIVKGEFDWNKTDDT